MPIERLVILDVGHGNCAVLHSQGAVCVIDAGPGTTLLEYLDAEKITDIDLVLLSHADQDHIGGVVGLLTSGTVNVKQVYLNTDSERQTRVWRTLTTELARHWEGGTFFQPALTAQQPAFTIGKATIEVLGPSPGMALLGPGQRTHSGSRITANAMSAVIRVSYDGTPVGLLAADMDAVGLDDILNRATPPSMRAPIIVFPHHGGGTGRDATQFTRHLMAHVLPDTVAFSIGRGRFNNPQPGIVQTVRSARPSARIVCTQLANHCATSEPKKEPKHLAATFAQGRAKNHCCAGSLVVEFGRRLTLFPNKRQHIAFIRSNASKAMCT
ncbi:MAG TPA: MBL fold metallo-hydrolase [Kofleriaceae bacterium]|jgi:competence protein ComEC